VKLASYWHETAPRFTGLDPGELDARADVVVVGGGFTGLSAALALAQGGAKVVLLEAGQVVGEASGRNGGQCNNGVPHDFGALSARVGLPRARALYHAYDHAVDCVERIVRAEGIDCDFVRHGKIKLAAQPHHFDRLARAHDLLYGEVDQDISLVRPEAMRSEIGSDRFHGGLVMHKSAQMHMGRFGVGLANAAVRHGARIFEQSPMTGLTRTGSGFRVKTMRGVIDAPQVLIATGVSHTGPLGWFRRRIIPVGSFIVTTEPLTPELAASVMPTRRTATSSQYVGHYFRLTSDHRLVFGGRARFAASGPASDPKSGAVLARNMRQFFPQLRDTRLDYCWGGMIDMTADRLPRAGDTKGLHYAMGYSGSGTQMSVFMGQSMAGVMSGKGANPLAGLDWPAIPGHFGPPWFLPLIGAWYRTLDYLDARRGR